MRPLYRGPFVVLGLALMASISADAAPTPKARDVCVAAPTGGGSFNTFIFRNVEPLDRGQAIAVQGLFFTGARRVAPFHGSAAMVMNGTVRLGLFVHSTAESLNDFTVAGITDANFVGTVSYDNDGDFMPNGTLALQLMDCAAISIP